MTKVVRILLISKCADKEGNEIEYKDVCRCLWDLQHQTRELKNKTVRECWEWYNFSNDYYKLNEEYPAERAFLTKETKDNEIKGYTLDGFIYDKYKKDFDLYSSNMSTTERTVTAAFKNSLKEILRGDKSVLSYKSNQPLDLHNKAIELLYDEKEKKFIFKLSVLNNEGKKKYNIPLPFCFEAIVKDGSTKTVLERCYDDVYKISASKLIWDKKKKQWCLNLSYTFDKPETKQLNKDRILGVNLGIYYPIVASVHGEPQRLKIEGEEIIEFRKRIEARRNNLKKQSGVCGDGRIGHGYKTRMKPVAKLEDKVAKFRDTFNHKASRKLIEFAVKADCGTIQMENLKGITDTVDSAPFLKNWSYYDLQQKIEYKAKEHGIKVVYVEPAYTSQRCSVCGYIHKDNHLTRERFICGHCGYQALHDFNASQNISIKAIDTVITETLEEYKKNGEPEKVTK